jgi:hypothetical protein
MSFPIISAYKVEDFEELKKLTKKDGGGLFFPTDVARKDGKPMAWFSVGVVPMMFCWFSSEESGPRDSAQLLNTMENIVRRSGAPGLLVPVEEGSPFETVGEKLGYTNLGKVTLFFRKF